MGVGVTNVLSVRERATESQREDLMMEETTLTFSFTCKVSDENVASDIQDLLRRLIPYMADNVEIHDAEDAS